MTESNNEDTGKAQSDPKNTVASQQNASPDSEKQNSEDKPLKITKKDVKLLKDDARIAEITSHSLNESGVHEHGSHFAITFIALLIAMFVSSLSETVAAVALPTIVGDLGGVEIMQWVATTYILTSTITMPLYGKLGDLIGRKYLLMSGLGIYALGKVVCAIAPNMGLLIAGRAISGLGGGGLIILSQATVADLVPPRKRGVYFGIMGSLFTVSSVLGPVLGGFFVDTIGWRFIFWFTVPLAALALVFLAIFLKQPPIKGVHPSIDYLGMIFLTVGVVSLVLNVGWAGTDYAYISWQTFVMAGIFVAAAVVFVLVERKVKEPVIPMYLFHNRNFVLCSIAGMLIYACFMGTMNYLPTYLEIVHEMNAIDAGLVGIPMSIFLFISSTGSGFIASRTGKYKWMMVIMAPIAVVGFFFMSTLGINTPVVFIMIYLAIIGFG
ncbi:MAG: MFS transporter, partial [Eggerthellaceae bacterium]|nr:MFS transporter [Eggerthellaceae bacterium]